MEEKVYIVRTDDLVDEIYYDWDAASARKNELETLYKKEGREKASAYVKSFKGKNAKEEAQKTIELGKKYLRGYDLDNMPEVYAFTDGSYNDTDDEIYGKTCGFAVAYYENSKEPTVVEYTNFKDEYYMERNVVAELRGAMRAMEIALERNQKEITLYYDCQQVAFLVTGMYEVDKDKFSKKYVEYFDSVKDKIKICFSHVPAHALKDDIPENDLVDRLAKRAVGIKTK